MKTQLSKPARRKASYTDQYKQEALKLWRSSGRSAAKVGAELGIRPPLLYRWAQLEREPEAEYEQQKMQAQCRGAGGGEPAFTSGERQAFRTA
jgi:transposase-like protein